MRSRLPGILAAVLWMVVPAAAQTTSAATAPKPAPPPPVEPSFGPLPAFAVPTDIRVNRNDLVWRMSHYMAGERVLSVGYGSYRDDDVWSDEEFKRTRSLVGRLQLICASQSSDNAPLIPFKVGSAYIVAPQTREQPNLDLSGLDALSMSSRSLLLKQILLSVPSGQLTALGADSGIAISSLPREAQVAFAQAFRPPFDIMNWKSTTVHSEENGTAEMGYNVDKAGRLDDPLDLNRTRIRARMRINGCIIEGDPGMAFLSPDESGLRLILPDGSRSYFGDGVDLPVYSVVPNTYKPSDLTGRSFVQPLNTAGIWHVSDVVTQIAKTTGLKLYVSSIYRNDVVFIGSNSLTIGEAIDGLRLALAASWRKLGDSYILAWDRMGIRAIQQIAQESAQEGARAVSKTSRQTEGSTRWLDFADRLPFDRNDPMALTEDQRSLVFPPAGTPGESAPTIDRKQITYNAMTPSQQAWVRSAAARHSMSTQSPEASTAGPTRPITDAEIAKAYIQPNVDILVEVSIPDIGWVRVPQEWPVSLSTWEIMSLREKQARKSGAPARDPLYGAPKEIREFMEHPEAIAPPAPVRGLMVPPLGTARLSVLAREMKRHGLNTLFYPVLYDGYATFASKAFPLYPALHDGEGWAAAVTAMAPVGIKVMGYLNTLSWQEAGSKAHYMTKHPDWLDRDVVGRPRAAWMDAHPNEALKAEVLGIRTANYVRPLEPAVSLRLQTLVDEFSRQKDAAGICFADWKPGIFGVMGMRDRSSIPALGFGLLDRLAELKRTGEDPVDAVLPDDSYLPAFLEARRWELNRDNAKKAPDPAMMLVTDLVKRAKETRRDWKTWIVDADSTWPFGREQDKAAQDLRKAADESLIEGIFGAMEAGSRKEGALIAITPRNPILSIEELEDSEDNPLPDSIKAMSAIEIINMIFVQMSADGGHAAAPLNSVIYDFRAYPEAISPSLQWIKAPENGPAKTAPATGSKPVYGATP